MQILTKRIASIAKDALERELSTQERARLADEVETLRGDIFEHFEMVKVDLTDKRRIPPGDYIDEQLTGLCSFTRMALGTEERTASPRQIAENVTHYQHKINGLVGP
ncbi:hypothetical protein [Roseovarius azorensis]|uniref:hypothetical protein n=1 Tax=Roseovarius azorensis TaxID=1287727 RepID=UPI001114F7BD|nr:hypothetical protein [Roseovarius azorensis]